MSDFFPVDTRDTDGEQDFRSDSAFFAIDTRDEAEALSYRAVSRLFLVDTRDEAAEITFRSDSAFFTVDTRDDAELFSSRASTPFFVIDTRDQPGANSFKSLSGFFAVDTRDGDGEALFRRSSAFFVVDTREDGSVAGFRAVSGFFAVDTRDVLEVYEISGLVNYAGLMTGKFWVVANTASNQTQSVRHSTSVDGLPATYLIPLLPAGTSLWVSAWRDVNNDGIRDDWEPAGALAEPVVLTGDKSGADLLLADNPADRDGDGLPDWWEYHFFASFTNALPGDDVDGDGLDHLTEQARGTDPRRTDSDDDGVDDGLEVQAGTDPADEGSVFAVQMLVPKANGLQIRWATVYGRQYVLQASDKLDGTWSNVYSFPIGEIGEYPEGTEQVIDVRATNSLMRMYRIEVLPEQE